MTTTDVSLLGPVRIRVNGVEMALPGKKLRSIMAILAIRVGEWVRRDELIEELELAQTANAANALHAHIARLRRWLESNRSDPGLLDSAGSSYRLDAGRDAVDAYRFTDLVDHAVVLGSSSPSVVASMLDDALAMWRGDALVDVSDGTLVATSAERLHQLRAVARETLLDSWLALGLHQKVIVNAKTFIANDPFNERLWELLMVALQRCGRRAEAIEAFQNLRQILDVELGIQPNDRIRAALVG